MDMAPPNLMSEMAELKGELKEAEKEHEELVPHSKLTPSSS